MLIFEIFKKSMGKYKSTILIRSALWFIALGFILFLLIPEKSLPAGSTIDQLVVWKSKRELVAYSNGKVIKTYRISLGRKPVGAKKFEGDCKTPEGLYYIIDKNPKSVCHKNLGISYPNNRDKTNAQKAGKSTGGDIKIHGLRNSLWMVGKLHRWFDWTAGCIAVTNKEMDELYQKVSIGTPIEINP